MRPCLTCNRPTKGSYCPEHQAIAKKSYNSQLYKTVKAEAQVLKGQPCPRCTQPMDKPSPDHLLKPGEQGYENTFQVVCLECNTSRR